MNDQQTTVSIHLFICSSLIGVLEIKVHVCNKWPAIMLLSRDCKISLPNISLVEVKISQNQALLSLELTKMFSPMRVGSVFQH